MSTSARIDSVEALKDLRTFLCNFAKKVAVAIDEADFDVRQTLHWLEQDRYPFWKSELRTRNEQLVKAKLELKRKQYLESSMMGGHYYLDEMKAVTAAQARFDEAQDKINKIRSWIPKLEKESQDCRGSLQGLSNFIQIDLPNRRTQIDQMIYALESYVNLAAPESEVSAGQNAGDNLAALTAATPPSDVEKLCKELRRRNPLEGLTLAIPTQTPQLDRLKRFTISGELLELIRKNMKGTAAFYEDDKLVYDRSIERLDHIYFEHVKLAGNTEIKWYVGIVKPEGDADRAVCKICDLVKNFPALEDILSMPAGWLVILKGSTIEAVFNAENQFIGRETV